MLVPRGLGAAEDANDGAVLLGKDWAARTALFGLHIGVDALQTVLDLGGGDIALEQTRLQLVQVVAELPAEGVAPVIDGLASRVGYSPSSIFKMAASNSLSDHTTSAGFHKVF